jgi:hypothetical protein
MQKNTTIKRIIVSILIGLVIGLLLNEVTFFLLGLTARKPTVVSITIPDGTAELVSRGEQPPTLPADMIFVVGDVLIIKNEDSADHQLGPLWIPAGTSGHLELGRPESLAYECSFQPGNYVGFDVREPLTLSTRIYGILFAGLPMGMLIALYASILPARKNVKNDPQKDVQP